MKGKFCLLVALSVFGLGQGIVSKGEGGREAAEKSDGKQQDSVGAQSIDRDYITGYGDHYGHGEAQGLSAHVAYGFPEGYEGYSVHEHVKHPGHHSDDHHHHLHHHHSHQDHHKHHDYHKTLAIKGLLVPLAGVALLGAAAAFVSNPILLQLGVISGSTLGRKKRELKKEISSEDQIRLNEIKLLEKFMAQVPREEVEAQEKKLLASYLSCHGPATSGPCLDRLACELHSSGGAAMPTEATVLSIIVNEILGNDLVPDETKVRISKAIERGRKNQSCDVFRCDELEKEDDGLRHQNESEFRNSF